jgi:aquaporin NIP
MYAAEMIATFILVSCGCGAAVVGHMDHQIPPIGVSAAFAVAVFFLICACGHISGAHMNPAVTLAETATRRFPLDRVPGYIAAQCLGAVLACLLLRALFPAGDGMAALTLPSMGIWKAFAAEVTFTAILMFVIMAVATDSRAEGITAGLAIAFTVFGCDAIAGVVSGGSLNPARSLGPEIVMSDFSGFWIYLTAPIVGAVLGALAYEVIRGDESGEDELVTEPIDEEPFVRAAAAEEPAPRAVPAADSSVVQSHLNGASWVSASVLDH